METELSYYNEAFEQGDTVREPYKPLLKILDTLGPGLLVERRVRAEEKLRELGATFPLPDDPAGKDRVLPADWIPRIIPRDHWEKLSAGLLQRGRAINAWLVDLYNGDQEIVPEEIIRSNAFWRHHPLPDYAMPFPVRVYGPDVVHLGSGEYVVLEDNVRVPSGVAYSAAIRQALSAVMEGLFSPYQVGDIFAYYEMLRATLEAAAPPGVENPVVAVVSSGKDDPASFEHRQIAKACDVQLLTFDDLRVRDGEIVTRSESRRIDVVYRRFEEGHLKTQLPELEDLYRGGKVNIVNALGVGVADDKAVFPYVPAMIEKYLEEKPILKSVGTLSLSEPQQRAEALERMEELVLKPREGYGGKGILIGPEASRKDLDRARRAVKEDPGNFVAQETLDFSTHIVGGPFGGAEFEEAYVDLRAFVLPAIGYIMPGGLTRVASTGTRVVNSSAGGSFKDTWVLED
jgi:carboxylate-amine ligase